MNNNNNKDLFRVRELLFEGHVYRNARSPRYDEHVIIASFIESLIHQPLSTFPALLEENMRFPNGMHF